MNDDIWFEICKTMNLLQILAFASLCKMTKKIWEEKIQPYIISRDFHSSMPISCSCFDFKSYKYWKDLSMMQAQYLKPKSDYYLRENKYNLYNIHDLHKLTNIDLSVYDVYYNSNIYDMNHNINIKKLLPLLRLLPHLESLDIGFSNLGDQHVDLIPLDGLPELKTLILTSNKLTRIPQVLGSVENSKIQRLNLAANLITDINMDSLKSVYGSLEYMNLYDNQIKGIPKNFGLLKNLKFAMFYGNKLTCASIPLTIKTMKNLVLFDVGDNLIRKEKPKKFKDFSAFLNYKKKPNN